MRVQLEVCVVERGHSRKIPMKYRPFPLSQQASFWGAHVECKTCSVTMVKCGHLFKGRACSLGSQNSRVHVCMGSAPRSHITHAKPHRLVLKLKPQASLWWLSKLSQTDGRTSTVFALSEEENQLILVSSTEQSATPFLMHCTNSNRRKPWPRVVFGVILGSVKRGQTEKVGLDIEARLLVHSTDVRVTATALELSSGRETSVHSVTREWINLYFLQKALAGSLRTRTNVNAVKLKQAHPVFMTSLWGKRIELNPLKVLLLCWIHMVITSNTKSLSEIFWYLHGRRTSTTHCSTPIALQWENYLTVEAFRIGLNSSRKKKPTALSRDCWTELSAATSRKSQPGFFGEFLYSGWSPLSLWHHESGSFSRAHERRLGCCWVKTP